MTSSILPLAKGSRARREWPTGSAQCAALVCVLLINARAGGSTRSSASCTTIPPPELAPANLDLDLAHISDVILRLHHRAGTVAPAGQGTFTPSCG